MTLLEHVNLTGGTGWKVCFCLAGPRPYSTAETALELPTWLATGGLELTLHDMAVLENILIAGPRTKDPELLCRGSANTSGQKEECPGT